MIVRASQIRSLVEKLLNDSPDRDLDILQVAYETPRLIGHPLPVITLASSMPRYLLPIGFHALANGEREAAQFVLDVMEAEVYVARCNQRSLVVGFNPDEAFTSDLTMRDAYMLSLEEFNERLADDAAKDAGPPGRDPDLWLPEAAPMDSPPGRTTLDAPAPTPELSVVAPVEEKRRKPRRSA